MDSIDREHPSRAHQERAGYGTLTDRTAPEDCDRVAGLNLGVVRAEVAGREDIRKRDRLVVGYLVRQLDTPHVGIGNARKLGLQTVEGAGFRRSPEERGSTEFSQRI